MKYSDKLKDPRWQKKRLEIMDKAGFKCSSCGNSKDTLNVHHTVYIKNRYVWDYPDEYLRCVCDQCHSFYHLLTQRIATMVGLMDLERLSFVVGSMLNVSGLMDKNKQVQFLNNSMAIGFFTAGMVNFAAEYAEKTVKTNGLLTKEMLDEIIKQIEEAN